MPNAGTTAAIFRKEILMDATNIVDAYGHDDTPAFTLDEMREELCPSDQYLQAVIDKVSEIVAERIEEASEKDYEENKEEWDYLQAVDDAMHEGR